MGNEIQFILNPKSFASFRELSAKYRAGHLSSEEYYYYTISIGLGTLIPKLAALLPDDEKRVELMILHSAWETSDRSATSGNLVQNHVEAKLNNRQEVSQNLSQVSRQESSDSGTNNS